MANVLLVIQEAMVVAEPFDQYKVSTTPESLVLPMAQSEWTCCVWAHKKIGTIMRKEMPQVVVDTTCRL
jgi:hypothetical protein